MPTSAHPITHLRATIEILHLVDAYCVLDIAETKRALHGWARELFLVRSKSRLQSFLLEQDLVGLNFLVEHAEPVDLGLFLFGIASRQRQRRNLQGYHLAPQFPGLGRQSKGRGGLKVVRSFLDLCRSEFAGRLVLAAMGLLAVDAAVLCEVAGRAVAQLDIIVAFARLAAVGAGTGIILIAGLTRNGCAGILGCHS